MDTRTGELITFNDLQNKLAIMPQERQHFIEVQRPITTREQHRMKINKYAPCGCGSGKKFKFCCYKP